MSKKKKWTSEEDQILVQAIKANPHNLSLCFRKVAETLDRTVVGVHYRWYYVLKKSSKCFITLSETKKLENGKVILPNMYDYSTKTSKTLWQKIKALLKW